MLSRVHAARLRADASSGQFDPMDPRYYPSEWTGLLTQSGVRVSPELAMTLSALWSGVTFLAKNVGSFPCLVYKHLAPAGQIAATNHPLYHVLLREPNTIQTAMEFWEMCVGHLTLRGNFYAEIVAGPRGFADQLIPRHPDRVRAARLPNGRLQYVVQTQGAANRTLTADEMFHVRGFSSDGVTGLSMIAFGANSLGASIAADSYAGRFFRTGASAALAARHPGVLGEEGQKNLRASINTYLTGLENVGGVLILEENMSIDKIGISPTDAQLLSTREHSVREIARWLGLPSYVLSDGGKPPTYASAYQYAQDLVTYSFRPLVRRIEERIVKDLILANETYFAEFDMDAMLRGDIQARTQLYRFAILDGWMTRNEVRVKEHLNPADGLDNYLEPMNMRNTGQVEQPQPAAPPVDQVPGSQARRDVRATMLAIEAAARVVRKEIAVVTKKARDYAGDATGFHAEITAFYDDHAKFVAETLKLPMDVAREYAARQGLRIQESETGIAVIEDWEWTVPLELAPLVLEGERRSA